MARNRNKYGEILPVALILVGVVVNAAGESLLRIQNPGRSNPG